MEGLGRGVRRQSPRPMGPSFSSEGSMPTERLSMRKIRDVLRLKFESGLSERVIARSMSLSNGSVNSYLQRARMAGLRWPLPVDLDDEALERLLFPPAATAGAARARPRPDWADVDKEMRRKGVTLASGGDARAKTTDVLGSPSAAASVWPRVDCRWVRSGASHVRRLDRLERQHRSAPDSRQAVQSERRRALRRLRPQRPPARRKRGPSKRGNIERSSSARNPFSETPI